MPAHILIIEDNPANMELMRYLLRAWGHRVSSADNGEDGMLAAQREPPDLIVCDIQLPGVDGFEVARRLKSDPTRCMIPLLAVTALAMVGDREKLMAAGFDGYIAKPIEPGSFVSQIDAFLGAGEGGTSPIKGEPASISRPKMQGHGARTILVVDDRDAILEFAVSLLEHSGYRVASAQNMEPALELARRLKPDLILSDVVWMSGGNGYELIEQIKADAGLRDIPVVLITSTLTDPSDRNKGLTLGAACYLTRPIDPEQLLAEIEACLRDMG